tara:strand:+ start:208 stop:546 length:339 start_codon:yes stop_codon:yes gene_type:complete
MSTESQLSKDEFKAFLLIYAAQTNFIETNEEIEFIESRFPADIIKSVRKIIKPLNDFQKVEIIRNQIKSENYTQDELDSILEEIKGLYQADTKYDTLEKTMFSMLEKYLRIN